MAGNGHLLSCIIDVSGDLWKILTTENWLRSGWVKAFAATSGSNDDWYWLYAAVKLKCLLVTNDEMRDHNFELLGSSYFLKWKERHQVRYTFVKGNLKLQMPPPYSSVIQESENGSWHVPVGVADESCQKPARTWLCITRPSVSKACDEVSQNFASSQNGVICDNPELVRSCTSESVASDRNKTTVVTGKRKERSPSPSCLNISPA